MGRTAALPSRTTSQQHSAAQTAGHAHIVVTLGANLHQSIEVCKTLATHLGLRRCRSWSWPNKQHSARA
ncbi:hypothetical protein M441DRAFT_140363 [Trichoderma asperellum CBS 433.97]|uniref:Uncharacterized protein n=1 Tax=Trichoderma asperellum (strain ATCC 204424 / CBS 433.97 / NBRC 101777) TaxID=1042311 RepID=A0A2T3Z6M5_TRIA4|nr:hypothetical protein M441DRAFT_140363 [Trichoderma asperellum CBS 433.97]PTB40469.1 hypothetical protein M441DRAFT_140363 [Trichoderma asperellum CBS 433.97]